MRLFIALSLPPEARGPLTALQERLPVGRPVPEENLHLTLAFLGDQPDEAVEALHDALSTLRAPAVPLTLSGAALFGGKSGQAVGLEADGGKALTEMFDRVRSRLRSAGVTVERRRFRPHVTLARLKGGADASGALSVLAGASVGPVVATSFGLFRSHLHRDGAIHEAMAVYPLVV